MGMPGCDTSFTFDNFRIRQLSFINQGHCGEEAEKVKSAAFQPGTCFSNSPIPARNTGGCLKKPAFQRSNGLMKL